MADVNPAYVAAGAGLVGVIVGSMSSIIANLVQSRIKDRRERIAQATTMAIEEHKAFLLMAESSHHPVSVPPIAASVSFYIEVLDELEKGAISPSAWANIMKRNAKLMAAVRKADEERRSEDG